MIQKYNFKKLPPIGDKNYLFTIGENDRIIIETVEHLFSLLPPTIKVNDIQDAYLYVRKIDDTWWSCSYRTWKDVKNKNFEMVDYLTIQDVSLKMCLYRMCLELKK